MIGSKGRNWEAGVSGTGPRQKGEKKKEKKRKGGCNKVCAPGHVELSPRCPRYREPTGD